MKLTLLVLLAIFVSYISPIYATDKEDSKESDITKLENAIKEKETQELKVPEKKKETPITSYNKSQISNKNEPRTFQIITTTKDIENSKNKDKDDLILSSRSKRKVEIQGTEVVASPEPKEPKEPKVIILDSQENIKATNTTPPAVTTKDTKANNPQKLKNKISVPIQVKETANFTDLNRILANPVDKQVVILHGKLSQSLSSRLFVFKDKTAFGNMEIEPNLWKKANYDEYILDQDIYFLAQIRASEDQSVYLTVIKIFPKDFAQTAYILTKEDSKSIRLYNKSIEEQEYDVVEDEESTNAEEPIPSSEN